MLGTSLYYVLYSSSEDDSEGETFDQTNPSCMYAALWYLCLCEPCEALSIGPLMYWNRNMCFDGLCIEI